MPPVGGLQAPPIATAPLLLFLPLPTSSASQGGSAASSSKERKHLKAVPTCTGEGKHNWCCLPCQDLSTASNEWKEAAGVSWFSFDFAVSCDTFWGTSHCWLLHLCYPPGSQRTFVFITPAPSCCFFLTSSGSESCFPRPLSNNPSSAVLCMEGCSLNLFPQKAHYKTCLISAYLSLLMPDRVNLQTLPAVDPAVCSGLFWPASTFWN